MKILIIEDDKDLMSFLKKNLKEEGFIVENTENGNTGLYMAINNHYSVIILDLNIPEKKGEEVCREIRINNITTPILILTGKIDTENKVKLLNLGADDYLTKPFSFKELIARTKALLRRQDKIKENIISIKNIKIDCDKQRITIGKKEVTTTNKEFSLLEYLAINKGKIISRKEIFENIWDSEIDIFSNTIEAHISNIRKKLNKEIIKTVSGRGYKIN